jgi:hypothetical protein
MTIAPSQMRRTSGIEVEAHDPAAVFQLVAQHHVEVAGERDMDGGLGGGLARAS